ncbi:NADPH-dependent FMN reductase [Gloeothece verrucosa]|uniref:NADPH-dependent FMN reductase n=1 Tax=Gloeothece verrucosa (strain PCC 7822) TaxID=497965 RepID=E0UKY9_GLOV7|nr:NADPH-dependent FMN reductase [Gloeothece verrucosa]ADN17619.1 NADPH-dependent FMN reductase [Gloeothece verrucosa PCC 7822]
MYVPIVLGSSRVGRRSLKVAQWILQELQGLDRVATELIDLGEYQLPILEERLNQMAIPIPGVVKFCAKLGEADGIVIVTPEYKGGYPAVLKNALDYLEPQALRYKPIGICTVSAGGFGGLDCLSGLRLVCLALGGLPIPDKFPISRVGEMFDEQGNLLFLDLKPKLQAFFRELLWYTEAMKNHKS